MDAYVITIITQIIFWGVFICALIFALGAMWGIITNRVIKNKGYNKSWFWWGFFFGFFALIAALAKPRKATKLIELKILLDSNIISQEEYDKQKLNLMNQ